MVEHVDDVRAFTKTLGGLTRDKGLVIMSTLNRTLRSYLTAIVGAEQITRIIPAGTHDWSKFLTPGVGRVHDHPCRAGTPSCPPRPCQRMLQAGSSSAWQDTAGRLQ